MLSERELSAAVGSTAYGPDGGKIGTVEHFFVDDRTGQPTWVAVTTGLFGTRHSVVPAEEAVYSDGGLQLPVTKDAVRSAPAIGDTEHLDPGDEAELRRHYGLAGDTTPLPRRDPKTLASDAVRPDAVRPDAVRPDAPAADGAPGGAGTRAPEDAAAADGAMTRSEERLRVGTDRVATTRMRVVKYVVTEEVQVTVPVRREEIRLEEVPLDAPDPGPGESLLDDAPDAGRHAQGGTARAAANGDGATRDELPDEIVLHREEPVVGVRVVPVERVRLRTEVVAGEERVSAQLQRERIAVDQDAAGDRPGRPAAPPPVAR